MNWTSRKLLKIRNPVWRVKGQWIRVLSSANGQPCYAGAGSQAVWLEVFEVWWSVFCMDVCSGGERKNGGEKFCGMRHSRCVNGVGRRNHLAWGWRICSCDILGTCSCALFSLLNPRLPKAVTGCRRSEGDQESGFVSLCDTVTNTKRNSGKLSLWCFWAVPKPYSSQFYSPILLIVLL